MYTHVHMRYSKCTHQFLKYLYFLNILNHKFKDKGFFFSKYNPLYFQITIIPSSPFPPFYLSFFFPFSLTTSGRFCRSCCRLVHSSLMLLLRARLIHSGPLSPLRPRAMKFKIQPHPQNLSPPSKSYFFSLKK